MAIDGVGAAVSAGRTASAGVAGAVEASGGGIGIGRARRAFVGHCGAAVAAAVLGAPGDAAATARARPPAASAASAAGRVVPATLLIVGDSLSAEYGLARGSGWVALLERRLAERRLPTRVVNASISGETTSGGRSRLPALLRSHRPTHVVVELGGNDALRGLPLAMTRDNLGAMVREIKAAGATPAIVGMMVPPNYGGRYGAEFSALFGEVARAEGALLVPFLLDGITEPADAPRFFQGDRIHPSAAAQPRLLDNVWAVVERWWR